VLVPSHYLKVTGNSKWQKNVAKDPYLWSIYTVQRLIQKREYCGDVVNFKTSKHIKDNRYTNFEELTPTMIHEFIEKLVIHERDSKMVHTSPQKVEVHLNFIGEFEIPNTESEPTAEDIAIEERRAKDRERYRRNYLKRKEQADLYLQHREINTLYKQQKPKHKDRFYETHRTELTLYEAAERFLKANLDGKTLNTKAWKKEAAELTTEKDKLYQEYKGLKEGVRQIGVVRRSVEHILDNAEKMEQPQQHRRHEMER
jgi:hypothetical protein